MQRSTGTPSNTEDSVKMALTLIACTTLVGLCDTITPDDITESFSFRLLKNGSAFYWVLYVCRVGDSSCSKILPFKQDVMWCSVVTACWCLAFLGAEQEIVVIKGDGKKKA